MKTPSNELYLLIKSLNKTEKRYFKVYLKNTSFYDDRLFIELFNVVNEQKVYDEKEIKSKLKHNPLLKNFKHNKLNLSTIILKCLCQYHSESHHELFLKDQFKSIYILYQKGLYLQCSKKIKSLKKQLLFYERYTELIEICRMEMRLPTSTDINSEKISSMMQSATDQLALENKLQYLSDRIYATLAINERARDAVNIAKYNAFLKSSLLIKKPISESFRSNYYYYNAIGFCYSALGQQNKCYKHRKEQVRLVEKNPHQKEQYPELYISAIHNFLISCFATKRINDYYSYLKEFKKSEAEYYKSGKKRLANSIFSCTAIHETATMGYLGAFHHINQLIPELEEKLSRYANGVNLQVKLTLYYNIAYAFFGTGNYPKALLWINKLINHPKATPRQDIQSLARILNLIIHYEMGNAEFLTHLNRSAFRFINKSGRLYKYESLVLNLIKESYKVEDKKVRIAFFENAKKKFLSLSKDPLEKFGFEEFDVLSWLQSKIVSRPFSDIVKEKFLRK